MNFKQAVGSENIYSVFNVFVKKCLSVYPSVCKKYVIRAIRIQKHTHPHSKICVHLCHLWENKIPIRMANPFYSFNYFPLVSGSTTNLVFKKNIRMVNPCLSVIIRVPKIYSSAWQNPCLSVSIRVPKTFIRGRIKHSSVGDHVISVREFHRISQQVITSHRKS